jgi:predicted MPP superfamily phosphohydrolase
MRRLFLLIISLPALLFLYGVIAAQQAPVVTPYQLEMPGITRPLRIVQLSDSHYSPIDMPASRLRGIVAQMNALKPDLIVLSGDYISGDPSEWTDDEVRTAIAPFAALHAPLGVFAVLGNHDDAAQTYAAFVGTGVRLLVDKIVDIGPLRVIGIDDILRGNPPVRALRRMAGAAPADKPVIVLTHEPDFYKYLPPRGILHIAGHTHGGQVSLPLIGQPMLGDFNAAHVRGLFRETGNTLIVNSGVGTSAMPIRIGVPPEITLITLLPAPETPASSAQAAKSP